MLEDNIENKLNRVQMWAPKQEVENLRIEIKKEIESLKCCGNCGIEKCEYCIRFEGNENEGREYQDNWTKSE